MRFHCLGDEETVRGFRLAGVDGQVVTSAGEAERALSALHARGDCGVLILTQKLGLAIPEAVRRLRFATGPPLLVEVPGPEGPQPGHRSLQQRMQEAVGIRVDGESP
jgi:V/A-type H+-transporting ATPase subunit F